MRKFYETFISYIVKPQDFLQSVLLAGLGARVCYSSMTIPELMTTDKRLSEDMEGLVKFLEKLYNKGHMSVFEQATLIIDLEKVAEEILSLPDDETYKLLRREDLYAFDFQFLSYIFEDILKYTYYKYPRDFTTFTGVSKTPLLTDMELRKSLEIEEYKEDLRRLIIGNFMFISKLMQIDQRYGIEINGTKLFVNLGFYLRVLKKLDKVSEFFQMLADRKEDIRKDFDMKEISIQNGNANVYIIQKDQDFPYIQFICEGVSRIMTHQLVRHRLGSYAERSFRYTKPEEKTDFEEVFVIPPFDYIDNEHAKEQLKELYKETFRNNVETYKYLVDGIQLEIKKRGRGGSKTEVFKVKKEDARYILPDGKRTTIMVSFVGNGLRNFLKLRTDEHTQWEIREIANVIKRELEGGSA